MIIRKADLNDIDGITQVHIESWKTTYKGIVSESYLSNLSFENRKKNWSDIFSNLKQHESVFIAEDTNGTIIGFAMSGRNRNHEFDHAGEIYAIYILSEYQGQGIGRLLFQEAVGSLMEQGYESMMLWVLADNPSLGFYQRLGGTVIGRENIKIGEDYLIELAIGWSELMKR